MLSHYKINSKVDLSKGHGPLVIPPLFAILLFCFMFVMMHPHTGIAPEQSSAAVNSPAVSPSAPEPLQPLPLAPQSALPVIEEKVVNPAPPASVNPTSIPTATPQPTNQSSGRDLQSATSQPSNSSAIKVPTTNKPKHTTKKVHDE